MTQFVVMARTASSRQLPPGSEPRAAYAADAVLAEDRQPEHIRRGVSVLRPSLQIGQAYLLGEDRGRVDPSSTICPDPIGVAA
jgi:hypothetical protein